MADLWYPGGIRDPAPESCWGTHADTGEPKFVVHTTEGGLGVYTPDPNKGKGRRYYGNTGTWPNYTLAAPGGQWRVYCHIPAGRSAMALRNLPGGVQTNRDNTSQVEVAWQAAKIRELPDAAVAELAALLAWEHKVRGVPLSSAVRWVAYPPAGVGDGQRLGPQAWDAYAGVCGHQHVPENDHLDPGAFPIARLLDWATGLAYPTAPEGDVTTPEDLRAVLNEGTGHGQHDWAGTSRETLRVAQHALNAANHAAATVDQVAAGVELLRRGLVAAAPDAAEAMKRAPELPEWGAVRDAVIAQPRVGDLAELIELASRVMQEKLAFPPGGDVVPVGQL